MSFINDDNQPLILTKLTAKGRENIAKGNFTYKYWAIGDSEVDYNCVEEIPEALGSALTILRPKDKNPIFKTYVTKSDCEKLQELSAADRRVVECCVRNKAATRGFFTGETVDSTVDDLLIITDQSKLKNSGNTVLSSLNGTTYLDLGTTDFDDGDFLMLKITLPQSTSLNLTETEKPIVYLWYKMTKHPTSTIITLDRKLPDFTFVGADTPVYWYVYPDNDPINTYYATGQTDIFWDSETLEFKPECEVTDVSVLNQNNVWNENHAGINGTMFGFKDYGSLDFVGLKEYLGYNELCPDNSDILSDCEDKLNAEDDAFVKGISIIHFTNNTTKNEYGEVFFVDNDNSLELSLLMPTVMWHRRDFGGSGLGDKLGMRFISTGLTQDVKNSEIEYFDLVEDPSYVDSTKTPLVVGRVFPNLKIITIHNEELLAAMSYKSNRNWTLPKLKGKMIFPVNGEGTGVLPRGKTMYMTYVFESENGVKYQLPQQRYIKYVNNTVVDRDVNFTMEDVNYLPYMRQYEQMSYDGFGFYAHRFKVLIQIVDESTDRPTSDGWTAVDFTTNNITNIASYSINPINLENQNSETNTFVLTNSKLDGGSNYSLSAFNMSATECPDLLQFGDERFFYGNMETYIGACIYKSIFNITVAESEFSKSDNPTWDDAKALHFTEIGIFDDDQQLVLVAKISKPIKLVENSVTEVEVSLDF